MAIKLSDTYAGRADPPSVDYPLGAFKNCSAPEVLDGTPLDKTWANDKEGFFQGILAEAEISANGQPDKVGESQYLDALKTVISNESPSPSQATESVAGIAKIATQTVASGLSNNTDFVTPAKLPGAVKSVFSASGSTPVFACRAFVSFDGATNPPSIRYSGNVSSITDNGAGNYNINFQTEMPDVNYTVNVSSNAGNCFANRTAPATQTYFAPTTSSCRVIVNEGTGSGGVDANSVNVIIFR